MRFRERDASWWQGGGSSTMGMTHITYPFFFLPAHLPTHFPIYLPTHLRKKYFIYATHWRELAAGGKGEVVAQWG